MLRAAEGVGLDRTWSASALHGVIVDCDLETVSAGESYELDGRAVLPGGHVPGWPPVSDLLSRLDLGQLWQRSASVQPGEHVVELGPEVVEAGQVGQLVAEHVRPLGLDLVSERGRADRGKGRRVDACVGALRRQDLSYVVGAADQVWMAMGVDDVVEVAGPAPLSECSDLLSEKLWQRVADHMGEVTGGRARRCVAEGMRHRSWIQASHDGFIGREVELDLGISYNDY